MNEQPEMPVMKEVESVRFFDPPYGNSNDVRTLETADWTHVVSARFGPPRKSDNSAWSGDSYRYDLFKAKRALDKEWFALRWQNGGGTGWLLTPRLLAGEGSLLCYLATVANEAQRWDYCHFLYQTADKSFRAGVRTGEKNVMVAHAEGRLKRRKTKEGIKVSVTPKITVVDGVGTATVGLEN